MTAGRSNHWAEYIVDMKGACRDYVRIVGRHTKGMRVAGTTAEEAWTTTLEARFTDQFRGHKGRKTLHSPREQISRVKR